MDVPAARAAVENVKMRRDYEGFHQTKTPTEGRGDTQTYLSLRPVLSAGLAPASCEATAYP